MNASPAFVSRPGDCWYEAPGCHHVCGENASDREGAQFFAVLVVDDEVVKDGYDKLVVVDAAVEDERKAASNS